MSPTMLHNSINFLLSKELEVVRIEVVVDDKPVYCLLDVLSLHDELLWANHRSLGNATGKSYWSRATISNETFHNLPDYTSKAN